MARRKFAFTLGFLYIIFYPSVSGLASRNEFSTAYPWYPGTDFPLDSAIAISSYF
jgi:hypothetical protein